MLAASFYSGVLAESCYFWYWTIIILSPFQGGVPACRIFQLYAMYSCNITAMLGVWILSRTTLFCLICESLTSDVQGGGGVGLISKKN